jgi:hypothetical protein
MDDPEEVARYAVRVSHGYQFCGLRGGLRT